MKFQYNSYKQAEPLHFYLATPDNELLCALNGIRTDSVKLTLNLNDTSDLTFTYDREIDLDEIHVLSNGYEQLDDFMRIYVENIGWFIMSAPQVSDDGALESKQISAQSIDIELCNNDLVGFKVNCGTSDSLEMLAQNNIEYIDDVPFAKEQVRFFHPENPQLSLLHMILSFAGIDGWEIGYVDEIPKVYRSYQNGELVERVVQLKDEIGTFDLSSQNVFSFLTQEVAQFFECLILFDIKQMKISAYRPEHIGNDTNITIGFRNIQKSNEISVDKNSLYTRYRVEGDDKLGIEAVNFGHNMIENLSYFLNTKYMNEAFIAKYTAWISDTESRRYEYIECTRLYNHQLNVMSELLNRLPLDDCSTQWNKFSNEELLRAYDNYKAQITGYESFYVKEDGTFDEEKLAASSDANDYYQIRDVILPNIKIETENRKLPTSAGELPFIETYKTNWKLYGIDELLINLDFYKSQQKGLEQAHYDIPYSDYAEHTEADKTNYPSHTKDMHDNLYAQYQDVLMQLNEGAAGTLASAYKERTAEYEAAEKLAEGYQQRRAQIAWAADKKNWISEDLGGFTKKELRMLSKLYRDTDYTNNNMFLTDSDDQVSAIDEQLKLLYAAQADLETSCQPQFTYRTETENFIAMYEYQEYTRHLELGDFLYLGLRDDGLVKLRLVSCSFNPTAMDNKLNLEFSNMLKTRSGRYDTTYLLGLPKNTGKNKISGTSHGSDTNQGITLTTGLIQKILSSSLFNNKVTAAINQHFQSLFGQLIVAENLETELIHTVDLQAENGFFQYLQAQLIAADKIVADSAVVKQLDVLTANIKKALIGTAAAETGIIVRLSADNAQIDEAFIKQVIASYISVNDLRAGTVNTDHLKILSEDGSLSIIGNTQTFKDSSGNIRLQLGADAANNFSFIVYDRMGDGIVMDQDGIRASAISEGLIKDDMLANQTISSNKINWATANAATDQDGNPVWNSAQITLNDSTLDLQFSSIMVSMDQLQTTMDGVQTSMNTVEKAITDKVWRSDLVSVTDENGNTISKSILDMLVTHSVSIDGLTSTVKQTEAAVSLKADKAVVTGLTDRLTKAEQDAEGFRQTVTKNYTTGSQVQSAVNQKAGEITATVAGIYETKEHVSAISQKTNKIEQTVMNNSGDISAIKQTATAHNTRLTNAEGNLSTLSQSVHGIQTTVSGKQDITLTSVRYIRDWLNGSSKDSNNYWIECRVMAGNTNIAAGLIPAGKNADLSNAAVTNASAYTDNLLQDGSDSKYYAAIPSDGWKCLLLDLGSIRKDIDYLQIWHYYTDKRIYNHRLEISSDGITWKMLYDSDISGGYTETDQGRIYNISDTYIGQNISTLNQDVNSIRSSVENAAGQMSAFTQTANELATNVKSVGDKIDSVDSSINELTGNVNAFRKNLNTYETSTTQTTTELKSLAAAVADGKEKISQITQNSEKWEASFKGIGIGNNPEPETNIILSSNGIVVQYVPKDSDDNTQKSTKTVINTTEFAGYYDGRQVFKLDKDLTVTKRILVENGVDTGTIKMLPKTYSVNGRSISALVHIKSGGTS